MKKTVGKLLIIAGILILAGMMFNGRPRPFFLRPRMKTLDSARTYLHRRKKSISIDIRSNSVTVTFKRKTALTLTPRLQEKTRG